MLFRSRDILDTLRNGSGTVLGVIPARYGSTRLPGKPLVDIDGKPMITHVYERANRATTLDRVVVATDDERIVDTIESVGGTAMMTSPDHQTGTDRVAEVAREVGAMFTVNIQGDEPLIRPDVIDSVVETLRTTAPRVATPISPIDEESELNDENVVKVVTDSENRALYFSRSLIPSDGQLGSTYKHIGLYAFETEQLLDYVSMRSDLETRENLEQLRLLENGYDIQTVETDYESKEVNVERDIAVVEQQLRGNDENEN